MQNMMGGRHSFSTRREVRVDGSPRAAIDDILNCIYSFHDIEKFNNILQFDFMRVSALVLDETSVPNQAQFFPEC